MPGSGEYGKYIEDSYKGLFPNNGVLTVHLTPHAVSDTGNRKPSHPLVGLPMKQLNVGPGSQPKTAFGRFGCGARDGDVTSSLSQPIAKPTPTMVATTSVGARLRPRGLGMFPPERYG
jgi:hypothetical protein